jgi:hypothetical protein
VRDALALVLEANFALWFCFESARIDQLSKQQRKWIDKSTVVLRAGRKSEKRRTGGNFDGIGKIGLEEGVRR